MSARTIFSCLTVFVLQIAVAAQATGQTIFEEDFSAGEYKARQWVVMGDWDLFEHPPETIKNPGRLARFLANKPPGRLSRTFEEVHDPRLLRLSLDYGWGWGDADQGADSVSFMLLDPKASGYVFAIHRTRATWAVQWAKVADGAPPNDKNWSAEEIDATHRSVRDGGGLTHLTVTRESGGNWSISNPDWNAGKGAAIHFTDATTSSFSQIVLLGTLNFDEQLFDNIRLEIPAPIPTKAIPASEFLSSLGIVTTFPDRGQPLPKTIEMIRYCGFRWVRGGIEGLTDNGPTTIGTYLELHRQTGVKFNWGLVSGGTDLKKLLDTGRRLAAAGALLAFEGNNEPNNWGVTYEGEEGGGRAPSWQAVANLQRDLYKAVKSDPELNRYPVWSLSENGAQVDNMGLQFLTIPPGAGSVMPEGTRYADFANVHNYIYHPNSPAVEDNKTWNAADPTAACKVDGLFGNYGVTWAKKFRGYSQAELLSLPRVTTETGCTIGGAITEDTQALNILTMYLDQFKRGWRYTSVYLLRDRGDEAGNQSFGLFRPDYAPRKAAHYLHNLTTILDDRGTIAQAGELMYSIPGPPATMHDLLLQKSDGTFQLIIWNERVNGSDDVIVKFERPVPGVAIYDPTIGAEPISAKGSVESLTLTLSNHPLVLSFSSR